MKRPLPDDDATVVMRRPPAALSPSRQGGRRGLLAGGAAVLVVLAVAAAWTFWPRPAPPPAVPATAPMPPAPHAAAPAPVAAFAPVMADEATIRADVPDHLTVFRFAPDPAVVVLDFPTLHEQGAMLNRVAALIEKAGLPRDRLLTDAELAAAIRRSGDTPDTYYYGHDYSAAELARFFALAESGHVALNPEENRLRALLRQLGWLAPGAMGAVISVPRVPQVGVTALDASARAVILHHELSHGLFFTDPAYAAFARQFWTTALTAGERDRMRKFLGGEGYDTGDEMLIINETQAYLMFTDDPRFGKSGDFGMTQARRADLARQFLAGMPTGWLRDSLAQDIPNLR